MLHANPVNRTALLAALAVAAWVLPAQAQDAVRAIPVQARPVAVTVHPTQATVTRGGVVELPAGDSLLVLSAIPAGLVRDSVTARGRAPAAVTIGAVEVRQVSFDPQASNQRVAELDARLHQIEDEIAAVDVRIDAFGAQRALIERLGAGFAEFQRRPPQANEVPPLQAAADPSGWRAAWEAVRDGTGEAAEAIRIARIGKRELEARRAALQSERNLLGAPPSAAGSLEIAVAVRAEAATRLELSVSYQVPGARWLPVYEARLDTQAGRLALRQEAIVAQRTGEDWTDVELTLSSARPSGETRPPELRPWRIALREVPRYEARQERALGAPAPMQAVPPPAAYAPSPTMAFPAEAPARPASPAFAPAPPPPPPRDTDVVGATVATTGFAAEYRVPDRASVRSDGTERRVRIGDVQAEAALAVRTVPRLDPRAFLEARFVNPAQAPLLPGSASLFLDGVLVGRTSLPLLRPQEEAVLPFGADDRVRVAYAPQLQRRGEEGSLLTGRTSTRAADALITVSNFHARPIEVSVLDQAPVSGDEQLSVALRTDPPPTQRDVEDRPGVLAWKATYAPGEVRQIRFGYTITAPRDREIAGMER